MPCSRMSRSRSGQTAYVRSARVSGRSLRTSYRIMTPWLGRPTSYASGYISAQRTAAASQSLTEELSSPPTYWIGFWTRGSSGSKRGKTDSTVMGPEGRSPAAVRRRRRCLSGGLAAAGVHVEQQADGHPVREHRGPAVGDERQRQPGDRHDPERHPDVDERLEGEPAGHSPGHQPPEQV